MEGEEDLIPYKIVDVTREKRFGIVANSLEDLVARGELFTKVMQGFFFFLSLVSINYYFYFFYIQLVKNLAYQEVSR